MSPEKSHNPFHGQLGVTPPQQITPVPPLHGGSSQAHDSAKQTIEHRHQESVSRYPRLHLSKNEYVLEEVRRHPIGIISIWAIVLLLVFAIFFALTFYNANVAMLSESFLMGKGSLPSGAALFPGVLLLAIFFVLGGVIATIVYNGNRFYLTNESVFQFVQKSLFVTKTQVVNLVNVEDASDDKVGILQQVLNYGTLRLSTQGEETTYHFYFVSNPGRIVGLVNDAAEKAVKKLEGVPVSER
ncbi:MAG TPA: hypothetical protein VFT87_01850 [Candidatus Saccharimonadales bacterium]|nr:hypothetical protein [Candidatus Saccharimonadales bacterium]